MRTDEVTLDAQIDGLPSLMDFIMLRDAMSFTRTAEVAPDVTVDRFTMADDDSATTDDLPLHATASITDIPRHVLFHADLSDPDEAIERGELTSWTLACPGEPAPPGPPAPDDIRRPDLTDTLPLHPVGCQRHALTPIPSAEVIVQSWLPEDLDAQAVTSHLRTPPLDATQFGYFAQRDVNPLSADPLYSFGARINGVQRATVDVTEPPPDGDRRAPVSRACPRARRR